MSILDNVAGLVSSVAGSLLFSNGALVSRGAAARDGRGGFTYINVITEIKALVADSDVGHEGGALTAASDRVSIMIPLSGVPVDVSSGAYIALDGVAYNILSVDIDAAEAVATCSCERAGIAIGQGLDTEIILGSIRGDGSANARLVQVLSNIVANSSASRGAASATASIALDSIIIAATGTVAVPPQLHAGAIITLEGLGQVTTVQARVLSQAIGINSLQNVNQAISASTQDSVFAALSQSLGSIAASSTAAATLNASTASQLGQVISATDTDVSNASYVAALLAPLSIAGSASLQGDLSLTSTLGEITSDTEVSVDLVSDNFNTLGSVSIAASATAPVAGSMGQTLQTAIGVNDLDLIGLGSVSMTLSEISIVSDVTVVSAGGNEPETDAIISEFITPATENQQYVMNQLIIALKSAGTWDKMDAFYSAKQAEAQQTLINWKDPSGAQLDSGAGNTFTSYEYWERNGATGSSVDTGFIPSLDGVQWTSSSAHVGIYATPTSFRQLWSDGGSGNLLPGGGTNLSGEIGNQGGNVSFDNGTKTRGHFIMSGEFPGTMHTYKDGVQGATPRTTDASLANSTGTVKILSSAPPSGAFHRWSTFHFGANLTAVEAAATYAAIEEYHDQIDNPIISGIEPESVAYIDAMDEAPDFARQLIIDDLFVDLKAASVLSKIKVLYLLRSHHMHASQINAVNPGVNDNGNTLSTWTADQGVFRTNTANSTVSYSDIFDTTPNRFAIGVLIGPDNTGNGDMVGIGGSREIRRTNSNGIYGRVGGPDLISGLDELNRTAAITETLSGTSDSALIIDGETLATTSSATFAPNDTDLFRFGDGGQQFAVWACDSLTEAEVYALHDALNKYSDAIDHTRGTTRKAANYFDRVAAKTTPFTLERKATINKFFNSLDTAGVLDKGLAWYAPQHDELSSVENWFQDAGDAVPQTSAATVERDSAFVSTATAGDDWAFFDPETLPGVDDTSMTLGVQLDEPFKDFKPIFSRGTDELFDTDDYSADGEAVMLITSSEMRATAPDNAMIMAAKDGSGNESAYINGALVASLTGQSSTENLTGQGPYLAPGNSASAHSRFSCFCGFSGLNASDALAVYQAWEQYKTDRAAEGSGSLGYQVIQTATGSGDPPSLIFPSPPTSGSLLIAIAGHREAEAASTFTGSSGWTEILTEHAYPTNSIHRRAMMILYKISDGTESGLHSFDFGGGNALASLIEISVSPEITGLHGFQYDPGTTAVESTQSTGALTGLAQGNHLLIAAAYSRGLMGAGTTLDNGFASFDHYHEYPSPGDEALGVSLQVVNTSGSVETTLSYATDVRGLAAIAALAL